MNYEIDITRRCNFKCPGCNHLCNVVSDMASDMTQADIESVVAQINANDPNPSCLIVVGGEPTLHPRCVDYCRYVKEHVRGYSSLRLNTNFSNQVVVAEVEAMGYSIADYLGPRDPEALRKIKADVHYNALISPLEAGVPIHDPHGCFIFRGIDGSGPCGVCVHRYKGRLVWCYCPCATSVAKLLRREDEFLHPTLAALLASDKEKLCRDVCVHCMSVAQHPVLARDSAGRVSECFRAGLEELIRYGKGTADHSLVHDRTCSVSRLVKLAAGSRPPLSVIVIGGSASDIDSILGTGAVARVYCAFCERARPLDQRVIYLSGGISEAVAGGAVPNEVDMTFVGDIAGSRTSALVPEVAVALGMCDTAAGLVPWDSDVGRAVRDIVGHPPDSVLDDGSWAVVSGRWCDRLSLRSSLASRFDRIMCLMCPQSMPSRFVDCMRVFTAYGIVDMVLPYLNEHNVFAHAEVDRRRFANPGAQKTNVKNCLFGHYGMVKFALDAGFNRVLFVEDDCRLCVSESDAARYIRSMPDGVNATVDYVGVGSDIYRKVFPDHTDAAWGVLPGGTFFDMLTCYTLNRDGMRCVVDYFEACGTAGYKWPVDAADRVWPHLTESLPVYIPRVRFAVQNGGRSLINGVTV